MARPKAAVEQPEEIQSPEDHAELRRKAKAEELHNIILDMIPRMVEGTTSDLNKHQIQASVYSRLEQWANKQLKKDNGLFQQAGVTNWDSQLPKYVSLVSKLSEERHNKNENIKARAALLKSLSVERQAEELLKDTLVGS